MVETITILSIDGASALIERPIRSSDDDSRVSAAYVDRDDARGVVIEQWDAHELPDCDHCGAPTTDLVLVEDFETDASEWRCARCAQEVQ